MTKEKFIEVPDAPAIDGLSFRMFRGEADYPEMVTLSNAANIYDKTGEQETLEEFSHNYKHLKNCDPDKDIVIGAVDKQMVAFARVYWADMKDEGRAYFTFGVVHPDYRRQGIGTTLLNHNQARIAAIAAEQDYDGERFLETWHFDSESGAAALLGKAGYKQTRSFLEMIRDLSKPIEDHPMPDGIEIRSVSKEHFRQIWDGREEAFREHWGFAEKDNSDFVRWSKSPSHKPELWLAGWDGDEVAGMVLNEILEEINKSFGRKWAATDPIWVRRPWRKQGLAKALITKSLHLLKDQGMEYAALGVDTQGSLGAVELYTSLGYERSREEFVLRKPMTNIKEYDG